MKTLVDAAITVLKEPNPSMKVKLTQELSEAWKSKLIYNIGDASLPDHPARSSRPELRAHNEMPRRNPQNESGRIAFIHAIAHIELNAIDLAWDIIGRFSREELPLAFYNDWINVAIDEAKHFDILSKRLICL